MGLYEAQKRLEPEMSEQTRWQYGIVVIPLGEKKRFKDLTPYPLDSSTEMLNEWGEQGWELVNIVPSRSWHSGAVGQEDMLQVYAFFKRRY